MEDDFVCFDDFVLINREILYQGYIIVEYLVNNRFLLLEVQNRGFINDTRKIGQPDNTD